MIATPKALQQAAQHLSLSDPHLKPLIMLHGLPTFVPHKNYYEALVRSIIGQQLSVKAAAAIRTRFVDLFGGIFPDPQAILVKSTDELRKVGFSGAKVKYVQDLALHVLEGRLSFDTIDSLNNNEVVRELTAVKGIGEWTAHMFMMFCMGRLDILPVGDLGIKNGIMRLYGLDTLPSPEQIREIAMEYEWHPYESAASWYVRRSLDNEPK